MNERDTCSAALTSRTMYRRISSNLLILQAKNARRKLDTAPTVLEKVIEAAADPDIGLTSEQRLDLIKILGEIFDAGNEELVTLAKFVTRDGATAVVKLVKELRSEHKGEGLCYASQVLEAKHDDQNCELFDDFADIATSFKSDTDKGCGMFLLNYIYTIPKSARLERFDRLAPLSETMVDEQEKAESIMKIAYAIRYLPSKKKYERFVKYADVMQCMKDGSAKAEAFCELCLCISSIPETVQRKAIEKLVLIAGSFNDERRKRRVLGLLSDAIEKLPEDERSAVRALLPT